jgi:heme exporter protein B
MGGSADTARRDGIVAAANVATTIPRTPSWIAQAAALFAKDLRAELRTKVAISAIGVFTLSALFLITLATVSLTDLDAVSKGVEHVLAISTSGTGTVTRADLRPAWSAESKLGILWVLLCFAAFTGLSHSFVHEEEAGTVTALRLSAPAGAVYAGKLLFNLALISIVALVVTPIYMFVTGMPAGSPLVFLIMMASGCVGLAGAATIIAALAAKAGGSGALYGAIGLPLLIVFLMLLLNAATAVFTVDAPAIRLVRDVGGLLSYGVLLITVSAMTFAYVWEE